MGSFLSSQRREIWRYSAWSELARAVQGRIAQRTCRIDPGLLMTSEAPPTCAARLVRVVQVLGREEAHLGARRPRSIDETGGWRVHAFPAVKNVEL